MRVTSDPAKKSLDIGRKDGETCLAPSTTWLLPGDRVVRQGRIWVEGSREQSRGQREERSSKTKRSERGKNQQQQQATKKTNKKTHTKPKEKCESTTPYMPPHRKQNKTKHPNNKTQQKKKPTTMGGESLSWDWEGATDFGSSQGRGTPAEADRPWACCTPGMLYPGKGRHWTVIGLPTAPSKVTLTLSLVMASWWSVLNATLHMLPSHLVSLQFDPAKPGLGERQWHRQDYASSAQDLAHCGNQGCTSPRKAQTDLHRTLKPHMRLLHFWNDHRQSTGLCSSKHRCPLLKSKLGEQQMRRAADAIPVGPPQCWLGMLEPCHLPGQGVTRSSLQLCSRK